MKELSQCRTRLPRHGIREIMVKSAGIEGAVHLEVGEPNVDTPLHIQEAAIAAIRGGYTHYTHNLGMLSLRQEFADFLKRTYGLKLEPNQVAVTPGAVTALAVGMMAVVDAGEEVLVPDPSWPNYGQMVFSQGSVPVRYLLKAEKSFAPEIAELEKLVTDKTKAIMINTPGNPTGAVFSERKMREIVEFAAKHDLYLFSDEIYDGIVYDGEHTPAMKYDRDGRVIAVYGVSKNYAMTGWRLGFAVASPRVTAVMEKIIEPLYSCASSVTQKAAEAAYQGPQDFVQEMKAVYRERRDKVYAIFQEAGIRAYKPSGAFYMLVDFSETGLAPEEIALKLLEEEKVAVGPGNTFGSSSRMMVRISLATEDNALQEGARRIARFIDKYRTR